MKTFKLYKNLSFFTVCGALSLGMPVSRAQTTGSWTGAADANWFNPANWASGTVPNDPSMAIDLLKGKSSTIDMAHDGATAAAFSTAGLTFMDNYTLNLSSSSTTNRLTLNLTGFGLNRGGSPDGTRFYITINVGDGATLAFANPTPTYNPRYLPASRISLTGDGILDVSQSNLATNNPPANNTTNIGWLNATMGTTVNLGAKLLQVGNNTNDMSILDDSVVEARLLGSGQFVKESNNRMIFRADVSEYAGRVHVGRGQLILDGDDTTPVAKQVSVAAIGILYGNGVISTNGTNPAVNNGGGVLSPGMPGTTGKFILFGNYNQNAYSAYMVDLASRTDFDRMEVRGTAGNNGQITFGAPTAGIGGVINNTIMITPQAAAAVAARYPIITWTGAAPTAASGTNVVIQMTDTTIYANSIPGTVFYEGPTLKARSEINTASKSLDIIFEQKPVAAVSGLATNQQAIAVSIDAAVAAGTVPDALIGSINLMRDAHSIGQVLNQLTPQSYEGLFPAAVARTDSFTNVVGQRLELIKASPRPAHKWETHLQGYSMTADSRRGLENGNASIDTQGVQAGFDYSFSETFAAGLAFAYDFTKNDLDAYGSTGNVAACNAGIYGAYAKDNLSVHALGYYGTDSYTLRRSIALTNLGDRVAADPDGRRMGIDIEVSRKIEAEAWSVTPFGGLHYMNWQVDSFTENGPEEVALAVDKQSESSIHSRFGLGISREIDLRHWTWRPYVQAAWVHEFKSSVRTLSATGFGGRQVGAKSSREAINGDGISAEGGLTLVVGDKLSGYIGFTYSNYAGIRNSCTLKGGIIRRF
ncbi:MAG: autotransporter domain-containing protein [Opitutaceae bacterium]|jgi:uncharacterized protein with beta-barrel porin domain|nr:autotransporter domain-containing protein [Opitutaceae bacterium]